MGTFSQVYRLLSVISVYKLLKPPQFGNCTNDSEDSQDTILSIENFKNIFSANDSVNKAQHIKKIRDKLDDLLEDEFWEDSEDIVGSFYDSNVPETLECIIYYGFICKKLYKESKCNFCQELLYNAQSHLLPPEAELVNLKSKGWLNHTNKVIHNVLRELEDVLFKHIDSVDVFDNTLGDFFSVPENRIIRFECQVHRKETILKAVYYYTCMWVKQHYKQEQRKLRKESAVDKKRSKLQRS